MRPLARFPFKKRHGNRRGSALIAIALILMIAATTITLLLPDEAQETGKRMEITQQRMEKIQNALAAYALTKGNFLPCPARIDRVYSAAEFQQPISDCDKAMTLCNTSVTTFKNYQGVLCNSGVSVVAGAVPVAALNLGEENMLDGWGNKFFYLVDSAATRMSGSLPSSYASPFQLYGISTTDPRTPRGQPLLNRSTQKPMGLLLSTGKNANGAYGANGVNRACNQTSYDGQNCDMSSDMLQYVADRFRAEDGAFDDILQPILMEAKSCKEPVPCRLEKCGAAIPCPSGTDQQAAVNARKENIPQGCVTESIAPKATAWPMGAGGNAHDATRTPRSGIDIRCCNGYWKTGAC